MSDADHEPVSFGYYDKKRHKKTYAGIQVKNPVREDISENQYEERIACDFKTLPWQYENKKKKLMMLWYGGFLRY